MIFIIDSRILPLITKIISRYNIVYIKPVNQVIPSNQIEVKEELSRQRYNKLVSYLAPLKETNRVDTVYIHLLDNYKKYRGLTNRPLYARIQVYQHKGISDGSEPISSLDDNSFVFFIEYLFGRGFELH